MPDIREARVQTIMQTCVDLITAARLEMDQIRKGFIVEPAFLPQ
jgi:hypothetical protein